jgi:CPA2 family monovalent cation:H+ antiporter-2
LAGIESTMTGGVLAQVLVLLAGAVVALSLVRRFRLPPILGYLAVGMLLGPNALGLASNDATVALLAEIGVVFLLFTLGLEFSLPRMLAMKREVFGVGGAQVLLTTAAFGGMAWATGIAIPVAIVLGGALALSSTAIVLRQLAEQLELNRTHARLAVGVLLFQDLAFVPLLALATALGQGDVPPGASALLLLVGKALLALALVLVVGRWMLRPLFHAIARQRSTEIFTLTVLLVVLGSAWATHALGLSMALGAFLAGMLLAETEFRHQTEAVIKPYQDLLLGLFFVTVGMLLDFRLLFANLPLIALLLAALLVVKALIVMLVVRRVVPNQRKALRTGLVLALGGEFGFALLTMLLGERLVDPGITQPLLSALVLSLVLGPLLVRYNGRIADWLLRRPTPAPGDAALETAATRELARREHVLICGYGRVGQNLARVLEQHGFEFIALDLDPFRVRNARQAGDPVVYGDAAHPEVLVTLGIAHASALVVSFKSPEFALRVVRAARTLREDLPVLVRTEDDTHLDALQAAGATEVIPEIFETSLSLVSHVLLCLKLPGEEVMRTTEEIRHGRYAILRSVFRRLGAEPLPETRSLRQQLRNVILPPGAYAVGRSIEDLALGKLRLQVTAIRREGILGRSPVPATRLREGDTLVLFGAPEDLELGESFLLAG